MAERLTLTVEMSVTVPQALALQAMFEYWNFLGSAGSSRKVAFYVDGDGDFQPRCKVSTDQPIPTLTKEMHKEAIIEDVNGNRVYDFDPIAWLLHELKGAK